MKEEGFMNKALNKIKELNPEIANEIDKKEYPEIHIIIELLQKVKYSPDKSQKELLLEKLQQIIKPRF